MHDMPHSEESKKKMSDSHKGIVNNARRRKTIVKTVLHYINAEYAKSLNRMGNFIRISGRFLGLRQNVRNAIAKKA